ncbi:acyl carrier protein [Nonomuraea sp. MCN248]|uniref:Acyl carrier protein n=1 Tax=Nonomuraea corallina TaxID=2989783 RepID=A0ABT4S6C7_9ACTN|nr:acyl carrier protein [Nonomuraea corallina]MDA0632761.1 acyl carrier protein [Nonomuraea corallina]
MAQLSLEELKQTMRQVAGDDDIELEDDFATATFEELGFDSLAVFETVHRVERACGRKLPEGELAEVTTPKEFLEFVNDLERA